MASRKKAIQEMRKSKETRRDRWKEEEKDLLAAMFADGTDITEMALKFHRSEKAIFAQINEMELYERIRAPRQKKEGCLCPHCDEREDCEKYGIALCADRQEEKEPVS